MEIDHDQRGFNQNPAINNRDEVSDKVSISVKFVKAIPQTKQTEFSIKIASKQGKYQVNRSSDQFYVLLNLLKARWPGLFIPSLFPYNYFNINDSAEIESLAQNFQEFLKRLSFKPYLWNSEETKLFYQSQNFNFKNTEKIQKELTLKEIKDQLIATFPKCHSKIVETTTIQKNKNFGALIKKNITFLNNYEKQLSSMEKIKIHSNSLRFELLQSIIPDHEKNCINLLKMTNETRDKFFAPNLITKGYYSLLGQLKFTQKNNALTLFKYLIKRELCDHEIYLESLNTIKKFEKRRNKLKSELTKKAFEHQNVAFQKEEYIGGFIGINKKQRSATLTSLESSISKMQTEFDSLVIIVDMLYIILGDIEIEEYQKDKKYQYLLLIHYISRHEKQNLKDELNFWNEIQSSALINIEKINQLVRFENSNLTSPDESAINHKINSNLLQEIKLHKGEMEPINKEDKIQNKNVDLQYSDDPLFSKNQKKD